MISIFGANLADGTEEAMDLPLLGEMQGVSVQIVDCALPDCRLPLFFVSPGQINAMLPYVLKPGERVRIEAVRGELGSLPIELLVIPRQPAVFVWPAGTMPVDGRGVMTHANGVVVDDDNPASAGETIVVYATGLGAVDQEVVAGESSPDPREGETLGLVTK